MSLCFGKLKETITQIKKNQDTKVLLSNFFFLTFLQVSGYVFPLLTVPYLSHVIGLKFYGEIAFAAAIMIYFQTIVDYGFVFSAVRDIARIRDDTNKVSRIYSHVMWSRLVLVLVALILLTICIFLVPKLYEMWAVLYASFLMVIGHALFPDWIFQALEKMKYITFFNVLVKLIFTVAVFIFIKKPTDYLLQPIFTSLGYIVSGICSMYLIKKWGIKWLSPDLKIIWLNLKSNFDLFLNQIVPNLYNSASIILLGFFHGNAANGIYDAANKFSSVGSSIFTLISRTFYPFLSRKIDKHSFFLKLNLLLSSITAILLFILAPWIIEVFFPSDFKPAAIILQILSISIIFLALGNACGTNYLILKGHEKLMRKITLYSSIIGMCIAIPMVYFFSYIGVAIAVTLSRGLIAFGSIYGMHKIKHYNVNSI